MKTTHFKPRIWKSYAFCMIMQKVSNTKPLIWYWKTQNKLSVPWAETGDIHYSDICAKPNQFEYITESDCHFDIMQGYRLGCVEWTW